MKKYIAALSLALPLATAAISETEEIGIHVLEGTAQRFSLKSGTDYSVDDPFTPISYKDGGRGYTQVTFAPKKGWNDEYKPSMYADWGNRWTRKNASIAIADKADDQIPEHQQEYKRWIELKGNTWASVHGHDSKRLFGNSLENFEITNENKGYGPFPDEDVDTYIEFDYACFSEGEIHAIGFQKIEDATKEGTISTRIRLNGTQRINRKFGEITDFNYTAEDMGKFKHFKIKLSDYYDNGWYKMYLVNDHDVAKPTAHSVFRNFTIYQVVKN